jgi:phage-related protein
LDKPVVWLHGQVRTPPLSEKGRLEAGFLLRRLQRGESLRMPFSRPLPVLRPRCHELRIRDIGGTWRIVYRIDRDAIVIAEVFSKKTWAIPAGVLEVCKRCFREYDDA